MTEKRAERGEDGERRGRRAADGERRGRRVARAESGGADGEPRSGEDGERRGRRVTLTGSGMDGERRSMRDALAVGCADGGGGGVTPRHPTHRTACEQHCCHVSPAAHTGVSDRPLL